MGLFFDECAFCHNKVRKTARFCNHCGKPAPGGWWKCPSCGKWIGNDSQYCPHCNAPLYPENRPDLAGGVWQKAHARFAERFETGDVSRLLTDGLQVQEGTLAVLLDGGRVEDILTAGRHEPGGDLRKIRWFTSQSPHSFILVDAGEIAVPVAVEGLHTADPFPLEFYGEVIVRFAGDAGAAQRFVTNFLKENRTLEFSDIAARIQSLVRQAVTECCASSKLDDLVRDPQRRIRLHEHMASEVKEDFDACGLEVVRVSSAEFTGDEYEEYVEREASVDIERRRAERDAALRALTGQEELAKYRDAQDLLDRKRILDQEFRLGELERDVDYRKRQEQGERELETLRQAWEEEDKRRAHKLEEEQTQHKIHLDELTAEAARLKAIGDAEAAAKVKRIELEVEELKNKMTANQKAIDAARRKEMSMEQLIADIDDPDKREDLKEIFRMKLQSGMTAQQILATQGIVSNGDAFVEEMKRLYGNAAEREDRNLEKMLEPAVEAARHAPAANIIK